MDDLKARWVAALRSGEYKQGQAFLHCDDSFCCLGVLEDLVGSQWISHPITAKLYSDQNIFYIVDADIAPDDFQYSITHRMVELTIATADKIGISLNQEAELSYLNDRRTSFGTIADIIENMNFTGSDRVTHDRT